MTLSEFNREDYWLIKWPLLFCVLALTVGVLLFWGFSQLEAEASAQLRSARSELDQARNSVNRIEEEEATIIEYIGRYRQIEADGIVQSEDRLQFLERIAQLRAEYRLFPIQVDIEGQSALPLSYAPTVTDPGRPISLNASRVDISFPLLHEDDLARLLTSLLDSPGLLQPAECSLQARSPGNTSFIYLAQHFSASCSLLWYTFALPPPEPAP